jgi:hypothetical protein
MYILALFISSCQRNRSCEKLLHEEIEPIYMEYVSIEELISGHKIEKKEGYALGIKKYSYELSCVYLNNSLLNDVDDYVYKNDTITINSSNVNIENYDTLKLYFIDDNFYHKIPFTGHSDIRFMNLIIHSKETPCDSITNIFYEYITKKIEEKYSAHTKNKIELVYLFDKMLQDSINDYIESLPKGREDCEKNFFILNYLRNEEKYGFDDAEYYLKEDLKVFLDSIAAIINKVISKRNWDKRNFVINCIGYADERKLMKEKNIDKSKLEENLEVPIGKISKAYLENPQYGELEKIKNNDDLSVVRGYAAARYLEGQLKKIAPDDTFEFDYQGGGETTKEDSHAKNRKVELSIGIKVGAQNKTDRKSRNP